VIGRLLKSGTVIELVGDVGSGKTTLAQGIIAGMGFSEGAPSPTFTVGRVYPVRDGLQLHHFDFYRLHGHDVVTEELADVLQDPKAVVVVEWADSGQVRLPEHRLRITAAPGEHEDERTLVIESLDPNLNYVVKELRHAYRPKN
jgi:tRNA threonylcarbamoyladenosine biosynthesis protein TsaE